MLATRPLMPLPGLAGFLLAGFLRGGWRCAAVAVLIALPVHAQAGETREENKIETEMMFGFLVGTDIGKVGEKEFESETTMGLGKRGGSYGALAQTLALEYIPLENLRVELGAILASHAISTVPGLDDQHHVD